VFSENNFKVAVCLTLVDRDSKVLLTRRHIKMKIFPHAWVLPGGHVDPGESLEQAVIRELFEETGIAIDQTHDGSYTYRGLQCQLRPYYVFESVSMRVFDGSTPPSSCHIILFFTIQLSQASNDISLKLQPAEIDGAIWLSLQSLEQIILGGGRSDDEEDLGREEGILVSEDGD
jgi:8-oxo-dGTP pyrophosphatase MutT (NUDIX family)